MRHRNPEGDASENRDDPENDLRSHDRLYRDGSLPIHRLHSSRQDDQCDKRDPGPPAVEKVEQEGVMRDCPERSVRTVEFWNEATLHQRPGVRCQSGIEAGDPGAEK